MMPGFNHRGPENQGPMTGWGQGTCRTKDEPGQQESAPGGMGYGRRRRGRFGCGQGYGGNQRSGWQQPIQQAVSSAQELQDRADMLEEELARLKAALRKQSQD